MVQEPRAWMVEGDRPGVRARSRMRLENWVLSWKWAIALLCMLLACAAVLEHAGYQGDERCARASSFLRDATLSAAADGVRTFDLGGDASTSEVVDEVIKRVRAHQA